MSSLTSVPGTRRAPERSADPSTKPDGRAGDVANSGLRQSRGWQPRPDPAVEVRRSARRRRTVSAYREGGRTVVLIPGRFTAAEEQHWVGAMLARLEATDRRRKPTDRELGERAAELSRRYLGGAAVAKSIDWADNQRSRWGSCTPADGSIRISTRLQGMPGWVLDYVVLHELAHLLQAGHDEQFWRLLEGYPRTERARGFLEGIAASASLQA